MASSTERAGLRNAIAGEGEPAAWSPADRWTFGLLLASLLASLPWLVHPWYDASNDGSMYLVTARALAAGEGYSYLGEPFRVRPPGFSLLLAPLLATRGTDFAAVNLYVSFWGVAAVALLFVHLRSRVGAALAALIAVAVWLSPTFRALCSQP